jgi:hypothetical protein
MKLYLHKAEQLEPEAIEVSPTASVAEAVAGAGGGAGVVYVLREDHDEPVDTGVSIEAAAIGDREHVFAGPGLRLNLGVTYNGVTKSRDFSASTRIQRVFDWAVSKQEFDLGREDATEHALALCGSGDPLQPDVHIGSLPQDSPDHVCLDLVPKHRFEG